MKSTLLSLLSATLLLVMSHRLAAQTPSINLQANKDVVIKMNALFNEGKAAEATAYYSDSLARGGNINGKPAFVAFQEDILKTFPDVKTTILDIWADGDWVIAKCNFSGTHLGTASLPHHGKGLIGIKPSGKKFSVTHIRMYKLKDGKIVARQAVRDDLGMLQQLGIIAPN